MRSALSETWPETRCVLTVMSTARLLCRVPLILGTPRTTRATWSWCTRLAGRLATPQLRCLLSPRPNSPPCESQTSGTRSGPNRTRTRCGRWQVAQEGDSCISVWLSSEINTALFLLVNHPLATKYTACTPKLVDGSAHCTGPNYGWDNVYEL